MEVANQTPSAVLNSRLKSVVWNDFERIKNGDAMVAICKHCNKKLSASATSGTSHLKNHLIRCRKRANRELAEQLLLVREKQRGGSANIGNFKFDQEFGPLDFKFDERALLHLKFDPERSRYDLARMIILHEYPLSMVEHVGFRRFVTNLQPSFQLMSCEEVKSDCLQIYVKEKQKVYEMLDKVPGKISLTADMWSSRDHGYLCLTAHYFDESWLFQKKILSFVMVDPHSEQSLAEVINTCLMGWDIDRKLFSMTFDNSVSNEVVSRIIERLSQSRLLVNNGRLFHVRCATNILNMVVQDMLETSNEVIDKVRECVRYITSSESIQQSFNEMAQQVKGDTQRTLCLDCPNQGYSTYAMLEAAVEYKDVFSNLQGCDPGYMLEPSEWERARIICSCLKLFVDVANVFTSVKDPTANLYFPELCDIHLQLIELCKNEDPYVKSMAEKMKARLDTYWNISSLVLAIAVLLDPRFKMKLVEYYYNQIYGPTEAVDRIKEVSDGIKDLYNDYSICSTMTTFDNGLACDVKNGDAMKGLLPSSNNGTGDRLSGYDKFINNTSDTEQMKSELDKYIEEPVFPRNVDFNILSWWKVNAPKYPVLSMMARDVLGIPMSTVELDSTFNAGERVLDPYRSTLEPDILQALVCTRDWLQNELEVSSSVSTSSAMTLCVTPS